LRKQKIELDLFPQEYRYKINASYSYVNVDSLPQSTIWIDAKSDDMSSYEIDRAYQILESDSNLHFVLLELDEPLLSGDSLTFTFEYERNPLSDFVSETEVSANGTFIMPELPSISLPGFQLTNPEQRLANDLPVLDQQSRMPGDSTNWSRPYVMEDLMEYEAIVSTDPDQIAIATGSLVNSWKENGRAYFHYKSDGPIRNGFIYHSGRFEVAKEKFENVDIEIYFHPGHDHNLESHFEALRASLEYNQKYFGAYPFDVIRLVEFSRRYGRFAQSFSNTISYSEDAGFMANVDTTSDAGFDGVFRLTAHEMTHQWGGHQVIPADALGSRFITESVSEYIAAKILEHYRGKDRAKNLMDLT